MKKQKTTRGYCFRLLYIFACLYLPYTTVAQTPAITGSLSESAVQPNETFTITLGVDSAVDAYYFGVEVEFDPQIFEFVNASETGLMADGISIADLIEQNRVGASVTRTDQQATPGIGNLITLTFRVRQDAAVGLSDFTFPETELYDSGGLPVEILAPDDIAQEVTEGVSDLRLDLAAENQVAEGDELEVSGSVYVNDITVGETLESGRVTVWVGVNTTDSDPSTWTESVWTPMDFNMQQDSYHLYQQNVGFLMEPGTYYIALRAQLDEQDYLYGGRSDSGGGLWDGTENINAQFVITESPPFRYVLAGWNFDNESLMASSGVPVNEDALFQVVGVSADGFSSGAAGLAAEATGWQFTEGDEKYWLAVISTEGFQNITLSSKQSGTSASPRDFQIEVSLDSLNWELVSEDTIRVATNWSSGVVSDLALPSTYENQPDVYFRWIRRGDIRVDDSPGITTGNSRIDDVIIMGENMNPVEVTVWPGDTDSNGLVDELDVLPLGQYWLSQGPPPVYPGIAWVSRTVEAWIPEAATYADATGDGVVNYRDLLPVGLNFGEIASPGKIADKVMEPVAEVMLQPLKRGEAIRITIETEEALALTGISYRFKVEGIDTDAWTMKEAMAGPWAEDWMEDNRMLVFSNQNSEHSRGYATFIHKGRTHSRSTSRLAEFHIEAIREWPGNARLILERVVVAENRKQEALSSARLVAETGETEEPSGPEIPTELQLRQNYPNPFNPTTVISYSLPNDGPASMVIYDMLGREVSTLFNGQQSAGTYDLRFDGSNLASGIYIYRLQAEGKVLTRMFTLIK